MFFLKNHTQNLLEKLVINIEHISESTIWNIRQFAFIVCPSRELPKYMETINIRCWPLAFTLYKDFLKKKKRSRTSLPALFSDWILKKNIFHVLFC